MYAAQSIATPLCLAQFGLFVALSVVAILGQSDPVRVGARNISGAAITVLAGGRVVGGRYGGIYWGLNPTKLSDIVRGGIDVAIFSDRQVCQAFISITLYGRLSASCSNNTINDVGRH